MKWYTNSKIFVQGKYSAEYFAVTMAGSCPCPFDLPLHLNIEWIGVESSDLALLPMEGDGISGIESCKDPALGTSASEELPDLDLP